MEGIGSDRAVPSPTHAGPGIMIFGGAMHLRYVNQRALDLMAQAAAARGAASRREDLRIEIVNLGAQLRDQVAERWISHHASRLESDKTIETARGLVRLRAFAVPIQQSAADPHIMIVLEEGVDGHETNGHENPQPDPAILR